MHLTLLITECVAIAFGAGLIYGLFGSGSGLIMAPGYYYLARHFSLTQDHRMQVAIATTAAASAVIGLFSARVQWKADNIDFSLVRQLIPGLTAGTLTAVLLLNVIPSDFLKHLFGIVVILVSLWLWFYNQENDQKSWSIKGSLNHIRTFVIGLLWFLLGIALFTVPYLHKTGISMRRAIGCASITGSIFSAFATLLLMFTGYFHVKASLTHIGYVNLILLGVSLVPSAYAGVLGSKLSHQLPAHVMKMVYAGVICLVGILMLV